MRRPAVLAAALFVAHAGAARAQVGAEAVVLATHADPVPLRRSLTELRVVRPVVMYSGSWLGGRARLHAMADFEGWTMPGGELMPGAWGEGFMDRRHPHTYLHEVMLSTVDPFGPLGGRFQSQLLERAVAILGVRAGPVRLEGGLMNGDEPERPDSWPNLSRFGDSWSARASTAAAGGIEAQLSYAAVKSPEQRQGAGGTDAKWSGSVRLERPLADGRLYALAEWARTTVLEGTFRYHTALIEAVYARVGAVSGGLFVPEQHYGRNDLWSLSVALRIGAGAPPHRMGRYGVLAMEEHGPAAHHMPMPME